MELIGNKETASQLEIAQISASKRNKALPHTLLTGAAGCGKTSTAKHTAEMNECDIISVAPDSVKTRLDVALLAKRCSRSGYDNEGALVNPEVMRPSVIFIDEIHNLSLGAQEHLGILMEEWQVPVTPKEAHLLKLKVADNKGLSMYWAPQFTLIGATTNDGKLSKPFRDRFKLRFVFAPYSMEESVEIVKLHADRLEIKIDKAGAEEIAGRGRGVPRILVSLLERCRDAAIASNNEVIDKELATVAFFKMGIDATGLTETDVNLLQTLYEVGDPVGIDNLATILNESPKVLSEAVEPYLIQKGLLLRASKGRTITDKGVEYLAEKGYIEESSKYERIAITKSFDRGF
jgi:holliday junction DNA helicase RuvB